MRIGRGGLLLPTLLLLAGAVLVAGEAGGEPPDFSKMRVKELRALLRESGAAREPRTESAVRSPSTFTMCWSLLSRDWFRSCLIWLHCTERLLRKTSWIFNTNSCGSLEGSL